MFTHQRLMDFKVMLSSSSGGCCILTSLRAAFSFLVILLLLNWVPVKIWLILIISSTPTTSLIPFGIWDEIIPISYLLLSWSQ